MTYPYNNRGKLVMNRIVEKNKKDWDLYSSEYLRMRQSDAELDAIVKAPHTAFEKSAWVQIEKYFPAISGRKICVPSSGDNHAVFAFALLGAEVFSCDISENQLEASKRSAEKLGISDKIKFIRTDTMELLDVPSGYFDLVYTSNGVYVWLDDLNAMFRSVHRVLKKGGIYIGCDVHPFQRPFDGGTEIAKAYSEIDPIENEWHINFHWRVQDILNAIINSGLALGYIEEIMPELNDSEKNIALSPDTALPKWLCAVGEK